MEFKDWLSDHAWVRIDNNGIIQKIWPSSNCAGCNLKQTINNYVLDEVEHFRAVNHITKRAWKKHGRIDLETPNSEIFIYKLIYSSLFRKKTEEITFSYNVANNFGNDN